MADFDAKQRKFIINDLQRQINSMSMESEYSQGMEHEQIVELQKMLNERQGQYASVDEEKKAIDKKLKAKILMLEEANREYVMVSQQKANRTEEILRAEIDDLEVKLIKSIEEREQIKEDAQITSKINENLVRGNFIEHMCVVKGISSLDNIKNIVFSEDISFIGKWRLVLFKDAKNQLSLVIVMTRGCAGMFDYKIQIIGDEDVPCINIEDKEYFRMMWPSNSKIIMPYAKLYEKMYYDDANDALRIKFSLRMTQNEVLNSFTMVERAYSHKVEIKNFKQLVEQNVLNYCSFYDEQGFNWKILLKRNVRNKDVFLAAALYLLNGMYMISYDVKLEVLHPEFEKIIKYAGSYVFRSPSEFLDYDSVAPMETLLKDYLDAKGTLHLNISCVLTENEHVDSYMPKLARSLVDYNFKTFMFHGDLNDKLEDEYNLTDYQNNNWHIVVKVNPGTKENPTKFLMFVAQLVTGAEGEYEFLLELLHRDASKVICRPIRGYWHKGEKYEITHFAGCERIKEEGYINPKNRGFTLRYAVRPLRLGI